jgi:hypothetical protein
MFRLRIPACTGDPTPSQILARVISPEGTVAFAVNTVAPCRRPQFVIDMITVNAVAPCRHPQRVIDLIKCLLARAISTVAPAVNRVDREVSIAQLARGGRPNSPQTIRIGGTRELST